VTVTGKTGRRVGNRATHEDGHTFISYLLFDGLHQSPAEGAKAGQTASPKAKQDRRPHKHRRKEQNDEWRKPKAGDSLAPGHVLSDQIAS